jgi:hypothetical protein
MERDRQRCDGSATSRIRGLPNSSLARGQKLAPVCQSMRSYVTRRKHKSDARAASLEPVAGVDRACTLRISRMSPDVVVMRDQKLPLAGRGVSLTRVHAWCLCGAQTDEHGDRLRPSPRMPVERTASATSSTARRVAALLMPDSVSPPTPCAWSSPRRPGGMVASCSRLPLSWRRNRAGTDGALAMPSRFSHRTHWSLSPAKRRVGR